MMTVTVITNVFRFKVENVIIRDICFFQEKFILTKIK
jgi:hypothetical protein